MLKLPPIHDPLKYVGLYVYDFGSHVSVGYTAAEISFLQRSEAHRHGTAYEVHRVDEHGRFELKGARVDGFLTQEAMCFLRRDAAKAGEDFHFLKKAAERASLSRPAELRLSKFYDTEFPHVTSLLFVSAYADAIASWLSRSGFMGGDQLLHGVQARAWLEQAGGLQIASCPLPAGEMFADRTPEEVLSSVHQTLQR